MRGAVMYAPGDVRVEDRPEPVIEKPTDAVIRLSASCVCGSDLWPYRGIEALDGPRPMGHEYCGIVEEVGSAVSTIRPGQFVVGSFFASDNTCEICRAGYQPSCPQGVAAAPGGAQAERMRVPLADGTLLAIPDIPADDLVPDLLGASDVLGTGWFAAVAAEAGPGKTVAVVGDGAVGLLGVLAASQLGAERIIAMSRYTDRQALALDFGATDIVEERGDEGVAAIKDLTDGYGAHSVIEAVGTQESMWQAIQATRPGGHMGFVGVTHDVSLNGMELFFSHVHVHGGPAPVRRFLPDLIDRIWQRKIHPGRVFDLQLLPVVERILRWYEPYIDDRGTLSDVPEWNLIDWSSVFSNGRSSLVTGLWVRALAEYAEMADWLGNRASASWAREHRERARIGFEDFWDFTRGSYVDHILAGSQMPAMSQAAGAVAIVSGLAPRDRWAGVADVITDSSRLVVRSWIGGADGGYDMTKIAEHSQGVYRIDWDVDAEIVLAEPFFSYVVHDAVAAAGRADRLPDLLRRWSVFLHDGYDTFGECWGWGTPVHAWSATPTKDLVWYLLGVTPAEPGYAAVRVAPRPGTLAHIAGAVPTPHGLVRVDIEDGQVHVDSPVPVRFVPLTGDVIAAEAGRHAFRL